MTGESGTEGAPRQFTDLELAAIGVYLPELRRYVSGQRILYWSLGIAFVVGLAAQIGGYFLKASAPPGPPGLLADLLYALGWALWTGVVVAVFVQILPEAKRRQSMRALDAYEAMLRAKAQPAGDPKSAGDGAPPVS
jgi:hypothetical protein